MATLAKQLEDVYTNFATKAVGPVVEIIDSARSEAEAKFANPTNVIQVGAKFPSFTLPSATGGQVSSINLLAKGPVLITFYRGNWCPFCNIALRALQQHLDEFHARGVELVAVSPELPDSSLSTQEKNELEFTVLSDLGNKLARELGIVWKQPDSMRPVFEKFGHDLKKQNGDDSLEVPIPATFLVGEDGVVKNVYLEPDYRKRLEPTVALEWISKM
ncbi:AhpC-TSA-domain-containing protein [Trematosphaeria pertusa]|uniref:thioredoxin-dependent peroxiredoxin n=1 Tax=Trematosphaeria pertusa TaxID=390896 RepID=A0A6A6HQ90_9PLEO|nr:AhpC-TSA-domain-containing protein [Trematosphaeria pertusa]KAF2240191.1 AhpC-TSA-domain-containing protein [Trematosphaeria pertusa]